MPPDVGEKELQAVRRPADGLGFVGFDRLRGRRGGFGLPRGLADFEPDRLELARQLFDLLLGEVVLEPERLELGRLEVAALLGALDEDARMIAFKQFVQLILRQVTPGVLSRQLRSDFPKRSHPNGILLSISLKRAR